MSSRRPELTLNLGLRYEFYSVTHEILIGQPWSTLRLRRLLPEGTPYYDPNYKNFGPRVGWPGRPRIQG